MSLLLDDDGNARHSNGVLAERRRRRDDTDKDIEIALLNEQIREMRSALFAALRLRGLSVALHEKEALMDEKQKCFRTINQIQAQIENALRWKFQPKDSV